MLKTRITKGTFWIIISTIVMFGVWAVGFSGKESSNAIPFALLLSINLCFIAFDLVINKMFDGVHTEATRKAFNDYAKSMLLLLLINSAAILMMAMKLMLNYGATTM